MNWDSASWFSKLDLSQGFHQIGMADEDIPKKAFLTHQGHYKYRIMPFWLCNALTTFQEIMNELLKPFLCKFVVVFFDDILIYNSSLPHAPFGGSIRNVVSGIFSPSSIQVPVCQMISSIPRPCSVCRRGGLWPSKISAMVDWPAPRTDRNTT